MSQNFVKLYGRVVITARIKALTGLHIGGSSSGLEIGGVDNPVIRDPLTQRPYIPGSSLRGKMRSLLEKTLGLPQNNRMGKDVHIHTCKTEADFTKDGGCPVCHIFGVPGESEAKGLTKLVVRDVALEETSAQRLEHAQTDLAYTELKTEVSIDRITSAASPRNIERVPANTVFEPAELVFSFFDPGDLKFFKHVVSGLQLIEDDYLGGSGSRGSGKIAFEEIQLTLRSSENYSEKTIYPAKFKTLDEFNQAYPQVETWIKNSLWS